MISAVLYEKPGVSEICTATCAGSRIHGLGRQGLKVRFSVSSVFTTPPLTHG